MFINTNFIYDGIYGEDMNLALVRVDGGGFFEQLYGMSQTPIEEKFKTIDEPFFYGVERNAPTFDLTFTSLDYTVKWDEDRKRQIVDWLFTDDYKEFISMDNENKVYYLMAVSDPKIFTNGIGDGYVSITFRSMTPYSYSNFKNKYNVSQTNSPINLTNISDVKGRVCMPIFEFTLTGQTTDITFKNLTTGKELSFTGLNVGESIYVNNKTGEIISSTGLPRLDNCNRRWFKLVQGLNKIQIITNNNGGCNLTVEAKYPMSL